MCQHCSDIIWLPFVITTVINPNTNLVQGHRYRTLAVALLVLRPGAYIHKEGFTILDHLSSSFGAQGHQVLAVQVPECQSHHMGDLVLVLACVMGRSEPIGLESHVHWPAQVSGWDARTTTHRVLQKISSYLYLVFHWAALCITITSRRLVQHLSLYLPERAEAEILVEGAIVLIERAIRSNVEIMYYRYPSRELRSWQSWLIISVAVQDQRLVLLLHRCLVRDSGYRKLTDMCLVRKR